MASVPRRYKLQPGALEFHVGIVGDGRQLLVGPLFPDLTAIFFTPNGIVDQVVNKPLPPEIANSASEMFSSEGYRRLQSFWASYEREVGLLPRAIQVQAFDAEGVTILNLPEHLAEFAREPNTFIDDPKERLRLARMLKQWRDEGKFVFVWGKEFWMHGDGTVEST